MDLHHHLLLLLGLPMMQLGGELGCNIELVRKQTTYKAEDMKGGATSCALTDDAGLKTYDPL